MANLTLPSHGKVSPQLLVFLLGLTLLFVASWGGQVHTVQRWIAQEEYGHGFFIPLIALWLLWKRRDALRASIGSPSWWSLPLLGVAAVLLVLGELSALFILIQAGFLLGLGALILSLGGVSLLRVSLLPVALLIFAIPLPYVVDSQLSWRLQLISSQLGVDLLRLLGSSVYLEGNVIDLGVYKLQVVEACSGLRYLYPLLSIGFLMAYMYQAAWWQRLTVFLATIPVTVVMNSVRIAVVGLLVQRWGNEMADGFLHFFEGWIIFLACLLILLLLIWVFERFGVRRPLLAILQVPEVRPVLSPARDGKGQPARLDRLGGLPMLVAVTMLSASTALGFAVSGREEVRPARTPLVVFPSKLADWQAHEGKLSDDIERALGLDDYILADYRRADGAQVNFYVAYYGSQRKGVSPHSPQVCMPGGGWVISSLERATVSLPGQPEFLVTRAMIDKSGQRQLVYYWFEERGRRIANEYHMKWFLLVDALLRNRTDGALVRLTTALAPGEDSRVADQRLQNFAAWAVPRLPEYVPN